MSLIKANDVKKNTIRRDRFVRIAERRVNKIIDNFDLLGKCSNRRNYEYTEEEVRKIFKEIEKKVRDTKLLFQGETMSRKRFKL